MLTFTNKFLLPRSRWQSFTDHLETPKIVFCFVLVGFGLCFFVALEAPLLRCLKIMGIRKHFLTAALATRSIIVNYRTVRVWVPETLK